jgi:hypothetical protein
LHFTKIKVLLKVNFIVPKPSTSTKNNTKETYLAKIQKTVESLGISLTKPRIFKNFKY